jgi:outer membrane protein OmpA-like peptidoglycan-associated protein
MKLRASTSLIVLLAALGAGTAHAQESSQDVLRQLLPGTAAQAPAPAAVAPAAAGPLAAADIVRQLTSASLTRSLGPASAPGKLTLGPGREAEAMRDLRAYASMQTQLDFEPNSDLLTPEAIARLDMIGQALTDPALLRSQVVIGVHTNAAGSDDFNRSLANLRARAVVEMLATRRGVSRERLWAIGFGRMIDPDAQNVQPGDRVRVVNLGATPVDWVGSATPAAAAARSVPEAAPAAAAAVAPAAPVKKKVANRPRQVRKVVTRDLEGVPAPRRVTVRPVQQRPVAIRRPVPLADPFDDAESGPRAPVVYYPTAGIGGGDGGRSSSVGGGGGSGGGGGGAGGGASGGGSGSGGGAGGGSGGGGGGGSGGGGWSSDRRLKRHIAKLGRSPDGHTIYSFQYVWGGPFYVGVMAQEIAPVVPEAILYDAEGFLMVDYDRIDVTPMLLEDWLRGRLRFAA